MLRVTNATLGKGSHKGWFVDDYKTTPELVRANLGIWRRMDVRLRRGKHIFTTDVLVCPRKWKVSASVNTRIAHTKYTLPILKRKRQ